MAWRNEVIPLIRVLINDLDSPYSYTDRRLEQLAVVAAHIIKNEVPLDYTYTITIATRSISPDPKANNDTGFINLIAIKSSCLVDISTFRTEALRAGIKAKLGPGSLDTVGRLPGFKTLLEEGPCKSYEELKKQWIFGNGHIARVILSPFVSNEFDPTSLGSDMGNIERMLD